MATTDISKLLVLMVIADYARLVIGQEAEIRSPIHGLLSARRLSVDYNPLLRPNATGAPTTVSVTVFIRDLVADVRAGTLQVQMTFRQRFLDPRLKFPPQYESEAPITLTKEAATSGLWLPDTFFRNSIENANNVHKSMGQPEAYTRVYPDGTVQNSVRVTTVLLCPSLKKFNSRLRKGFKLVEGQQTLYEAATAYIPYTSLYGTPSADCLLEIASYGYTAQELEYIWMRRDVVVDRASPVVFRPSLATGGRNGIKLIEVFPIEQAQSVETATGKYSMIEVSMKLQI